MRFNYRNEDGELLTEVSVNPLTKKVRIINHTDDFLDRAFGVNETPDYNDVLRFLESRTVPHNRADIRNILHELGMKTYDPIALCKYFGGRMAHDDNYVEFVR